MEIKFTTEEVNKILNLASIHSGIEWNRDTKEIARIVAHTEIMFIVKTVMEQMGLEPYEYNSFDVIDEVMDDNLPF